MGGKRLTYEFVKSKFEERGYTFLSNEYINSKTKLYYVCPEGHEGNITWNDFQKGSGCPICGRLRQGNRFSKGCVGGGRNKLEYDYVFESFIKEGYTLVSKEYIHSQIKLNYICPDGHPHSITWGNWSKGHRCPYCVVSSIREDINKVREEFAVEGYTLLSTCYKNNNTKLDFICPNGHKHNITLGSWRMGRRCGVCNGNKVYTIEEIKKDFEDNDYILLSTEYKDAHSKLDYVCPVGHKHSITRHEWKKGQRCPTCAIINLSGPNSPHWRGGKSLEPYCSVWGDVEYKQDIRERDGNNCLNPYCFGNDEVLSIHHIDYDKKNCHPSNLITVCRSCNSRANKDRKWHKSWYQAVMCKRYKYNY